jgi:predicted nucleic acid-binding protein
MSDKCFVDTNILFYAHDRESGPKRERARALVDSLWTSGYGVLSTQVLQEFCFSLERKVRPPLSFGEVRRRIENYLIWEIVVNTGQSVLGALEIETRYKVSFWDALIVHAAQASGADILYSEDLNDGQVYGSVRVVNPLRGIGTK